MIIEFIGLPGVGKSYICGRLGERVGPKNGDEIVIRRPADEQSRLTARAGKLIRAQRFARRHPVVATRAARWMRRTGQESARDFVTKTINLFSELDFSDRTRGTIVHDQGVLQAIWSFMLRAQKPAKWRELLEILRPWLPSAVIYVVVERDENVRRLAARRTGLSRFDCLPPHELETELERGGQLLDALVADWRELVIGGRESRISNCHDCDLEEALSSVTVLLRENMVN